MSRGRAVQNALREFVLDDCPAAGDGDALPLPGSRFSWADGDRTQALRRTWLDTFDWRLYRAGLTLEQVSSRGLTQITLTGRDGEVIAAQQFSTPHTGAAGGPVKWPSLLAALPDGPLHEHLLPVVGVRALLPVARAASRVHDRRVLNSDDKTVARVTVDRMSVTFPAAGAPPARLSVRALRGYQAQASRLAELLAAAPGVTDGTQSALEAALAAAGRRPADYSGKISVQLAPRMPAATAMAAVLTALLATLEANVSGTIRDVDTEFLHDLRIAVRRTRSALRLAGSVLPAGLASRFRPEFKWLGDLTTPTRDLDVYLLSFPGMTAGLVAGTEQELGPFRDHLARSRAATQRQLARGLRSARFSRLVSEWRDGLSEAATSARGRPTAAQLAASRIARAHRRAIADGGAITAASPPDTLHQLRKRCKELRYLLEIFGSLHDPAEQWQAVRELKNLQDCLGEFQDTEVQREEIRVFAAQIMDQRAAPAATLLAMGEIAAGLAVRQRRARSDFSGRFGEFASPASQARIRALTLAAAA
jgi:CHAD domain-containing protein